MKEINWDEAPKDFPIWVQASGDIGSGWHRDVGNGYEDQDGDFWSKPEDGFYTVHYKPEDCKQPPVVEWSGDGLPPVGSKVEFYSDDFDNEDCWNKDLTNESEVEIIAHIASSILRTEVDLAVFAFQCPNGNRQVEQGIACCFRPIKTKEQLEEEAKAQERERVIEDIARVIRSKMSDKRAAESLYELGYRKMENPE